MADTFTGRRRMRRQFGSIAEVAEMPNLIEVQKSSYDDFLMVKEPEGGRADTGLQSVFKSVFPISDFSGKATLEFVRYDFDAPKFDVDECQQRDMTFAAPLRVKLRLIVFDINEETGSRSIKGVKEQDVYMGDMPFMTQNGTFVINGTERVIVSQMHRSPGVFFDHDRGRTHASGKLLFAARIIPYRGSWLDFEFDAKDVVFVRIDRRRKLPVTTLLYALGLNDEQILGTFYGSILIRHTKKGWTMPFIPEKMRGVTPAADIVDAKSGEVVAKMGEKISVRRAREISVSGVKEVLVAAEDLVGKYLAEDIVDLGTGQIYGEAANELDQKLLDRLTEAGVNEFAVLDIDHVTVGDHIRLTLKVDKNANREEALLDIYRVMRPGEPPTIDAAETLFHGLMFDSERYDLSAVGRVKMNMRLGDIKDFEPAEDTVRVLRPQDILCGRAYARRSARRQGRDRRHRPSRQPARALGRRADGEPVSHRPPAHGARDQGAHELGRHRHGHAAGPDQRQAGGGGGARVLRFVAAFAVHGPDQPALRDHAQAASLGARPRRSDA